VWLVVSFGCVVILVILALPTKPNPEQRTILSKLVRESPPPAEVNLLSAPSIIDWLLYVRWHLFGVIIFAAALLSVSQWGLERGPEVLFLILGLLILGPTLVLRAVVRPLRLIRAGNYYSAMAALRRTPARGEQEGVLLLAWGKFREAEVFYAQRLLKRIFGLAGNLAQLARAKFGQGQYEKAEAALTLALEVKPTFGMAWLTLARLWLGKGENPDDIWKALSMVGLRERLAEDSDYRLLCAWAYALQGKSKQSLRELKRAERQIKRSWKPVLANLHYVKGQIASASGDMTRAFDELDKAINLDPHGAIGIIAERAKASARS